MHYRKQWISADGGLNDDGAPDGLALPKCWWAMPGRGMQMKGTIMRGRVKVGLVALALSACLVGPTGAGPLDDGQAAAAKGEWMHVLQLGLNAYATGDSPTALRLWRIIADQSNDSGARILALTDFANTYYTGRGVRQNKAEGIEWYRKAADEGDAASERFLRSINVPYVAKVKREQMADVENVAANMAASDDVNSCLDLAHDQDENTVRDTVLGWAKIAIRNNRDDNKPDPCAKTIDTKQEIGRLYAGKNNFAQAARWYQAAADQLSDGGYLYFKQHFPNMSDVRIRNLAQSATEFAQHWAKQYGDQAALGIAIQQQKDKRSEENAALEQMRCNCSPHRGHAHVGSFG
jgi:TPR repeat protein